MINSDNLCMKCMKDMGEAKQCPHCGFHADSVQVEPYLPIRTVLGNRYLVGKLLEHNGDGATYMGLDLTTRTAINIREYFPEKRAVRDMSTLLVSPAPNSEDVYNDCLQSFIEMWRKIMRLSGLSALLKVQDILEGNGTCYVITENIDGITLREYLLRNNEGCISWDQARPLLMPVLSTLGTLHASGIIHRGISPSTLIVAPDGKIRITGFSISQVRSARSELNQQLYPGYAAFEQYGYEGRQGTWTDIYGFGAVLYRTLIGTDPIDATERVTNDRLMIPGKFAEQLPAYVINGLVNALQIIPEDRTRNIEELRSQLSASPTAVASSGLEYSTASVPRTNPAPQRIIDEVEEDDNDYTYEKREAAQKRKSRTAVIISIAALIIVIAVAFIVLWQAGIIEIEDNNTTASAVETVEVPNFVGKEYKVVIDDTYNSLNFTFAEEEAYSSEIAEGVIMAQDVTVGSQVEKGSKIVLTVSKGKKEIVFPTSGIIGERYETAEQTLTRLGFKVAKTTKLNPGNQVPENVAGASLEPGVSYETDTTVYLFVWGEVETTTTSTEPTSENEQDEDDQGGSFLDNILGGHGNNSGETDDE